MTEAPAYKAFPDLASRKLAASVVHANDEFFAERENLIKPHEAKFAAEDFGNKGKTYDGWETRRRRRPGNDFAIVRLGVSGLVRGVDIDTSWFRGNYPPEASVEGCCVDGFPSVEDLLAAEWFPVVERVPIKGDRHNFFEALSHGRVTHVRLSIYPDGGIARFRVYGDPRPDPRLLTGTVDLAAVENGGRILNCSNDFYSSPNQIIEPGRSREMGDGWENARRRVEGNEHVTIQLGAPCLVRRIEVDTSYFIGNAPDRVRLIGTVADSDKTITLLGERPVLPDTRHHFRLHVDEPLQAVRVDVMPDGGLARVRVWGEIPEPALLCLTGRWLEESPATARSAAFRVAGLGDVDLEDPPEHTRGSTVWSDSVLRAVLG